MNKRRAFWLGHVKAMEQEGLPVAAYAQREGLHPSSLYHWHTILRLQRIRQSRQDRPAQAIPQPIQNSQSGGFVEVELLTQTQALDDDCAVVIHGGVRIECAHLPNVEWLAALSRQLMQEVR